MKKNNTGITIIALVITTVILLIFAVVAFGLVNGDRGLFLKAELAKQEFENAEEKEKEKIDALTSNIDQMILANNSNVNVNQLSQALGNLLVVEKVVFCTNQSLGSGAGMSFDIPAKEGYTIIGVTPILEGKNTSYLIANVNSENKLLFRNTSSTATCDLSAIVIYLKSDLVQF